MTRLNAEPATPGQLSRGLTQTTGLIPPPPPVTATASVGAPATPVETPAGQP